MPNQCFFNALIVFKMKAFDLEKVKNIAEKGEDAGYQHFSPFPAMLSKTFFLSFVVHKTHSHTMTPFEAPGKQAF